MNAPLKSLAPMPSITDRAALRDWLFAYKGDPDAWAEAEALLNAQKPLSLHVHEAAVRTGVTDPDKIFTHLPLFNHVVPVLERIDQSAGGLPTAAVAEAHFVALHEDHVHQYCGETHRGIPIEAYRDWLVAHKDDDAMLNPVLLLLHNRNILVRMHLLKRGETDPAMLFEVGHKDSMLARDGDGANIIPLDQIAVARIYGHHHDYKHLPRHPKMPSGADHSEKAIAALDHFLETVMGVKANHAVIKANFARTSNGKM